MPVVTVTKDQPGTSDGSVFLTPRARFGTRTGPMILDKHGRTVWFHRLSPTRTALGLNAQTYNGRPVLTWSERPPIRTNADLYTAPPHAQYDVIADAHYHVIARLRVKGPGARTDLHDMVLTKRGTALIVGSRFVHRNLEKYGFSRYASVIDCLVQEVDVKTNHVLFSWSAVNHVPLDESTGHPQAGYAWDYFHLNSAAYDSDGALLLSARHTSTIYKVSRKTGKVIWRLGGKHSDFKMGPGAAFSYQHDAQRQPDGTITLFDNHGNDPVKDKGSVSRALRLRVSTRKKTATVVATYGHPAGAVLAGSQGDTRVLAGGDVFVGWGSSPWWSEYAPDGTLLFAAHLPSQTYQSYRVLKGPWHARPDSRPALLVTKSSGSLIAYASWNGATDIATWRMVAGRDAGSMNEIGRAGWAGLETRMRFPSDGLVAQVQALDTNGSVMGTSPVVRAK